MLHSCNNRCFTSTPTTSLYHQFRLPLRLFSRRTRALLWRERHHSSSRFCWCPFTSHLFLRNRPIQRAPFWRKKRTAVQQIPNPNPGNFITETQSHRRRGNKHISHNKHHRPLHPSPRITVQLVTRIVQQVTPRNTTALRPRLLD